MREDDFERLYAEHARPLLKFLIYRTGDRALAEDLAADTFERALRKRRLFDVRRGSSRKWLFAIALNLVRDHARRETVERRALEGSAVGASTSTEGGLERVEQRDRLARALSGLSPADQDLIALKFGAGLSVEEIADAMRESPAAVESRLYRALRKLRAVGVD
jgi:RNA polymerase sigma-70 factor (ECF subfamily)